METSAEAALVRAVEEFAAARLGSDLIRRDREAIFDRDGWRAVGGLGLQGLPVPTAFGGQACGLATSLRVMRAFGRACRDNGLAFALGAQLWSVEVPLLRFGSDEQQRRHLPGLADGSVIAAHAMTEPGSGSDALALRTRAVADGDAYVLTGTKTFVTNAPVADVAIVFATVRPELKAAGLTAFLVERGAPGATFGGRIDTMGLRTAPLGEIVLDGCRVPASARLGREGQGMAIFQAAMTWERACLSAANLGAMERVLQRCLAQARDRQQFGQPVGKFGAIADRLVAMRTNTTLGGLLLDEIGRRADAGDDAAVEAAMAKLFVSESWVQATLDAIQIFGGYGYATETEIEREHRDAVASRLYSGTSEIQRKLIAHHLGL